MSAICQNGVRLGEDDDVHCTTERTRGFVKTSLMPPENGLALVHDTGKTLL